jgi:hypothetical protein
LDEIIEQTHITLDLLRVFRQELCKKNDHFLATNLEKHVFHKSLNVFFLRFLNTHVGNTLLIDDRPYKSIFNDSCRAIFFESFESSHNNGDYLLSIVVSYLVSLHSFRFSVQTYVRHNPFGTIRSISRNDPYYNILFEDCSDSCEPTYCIKCVLKKM